MSDSEIWRDVVGYEGLYQVSNLGRVKSLRGRSNHKNDIFLKIQTNKGYKRVSLCKNDVLKHYPLHRIVAEAFVPNIDNKPQVNHIDGDKSNNKASNLEWCTSRENRKHGIQIGLIKVKGKRVNQYNLNGEFLKMWETLSSAAKECGVHTSHIASCCKGKFRQAGGYIWKYVEENE